MGTRRVTAALLALGTALVLLAGCSSGTTNTGSASGGASMSASPSTGPSGGPSPSGLPSGMSLPPSVKPSLPAAGPDQTLHGQVEAGVEHGCLILHDGGTAYLLLGGDPKVVYAGATVTLTGHLVTGIMSYCMQGKPFQVTQARTG
jgi:hypothetical protein